MSTAPAATTARRGGIQGRSNLAGWFFVSPAVLLFVVFIAGPFVAAMALSLFSWDLLTEAKFVGLANFRQLAGDTTVWLSLRNTFVFALASVVTHIVLGLALAVAVNRPLHKVVQYITRSAIFFPFLISWAAVSLLWKYVLDRDFGIANHYLGQLGITTPNWLIDPQWALPALIGIDWWHTIGYTFVILLAGLQTVPGMYHEAAKIDGANAWQRFWHITLPVMAPTLVFAMIITFIGAFQIFEPMRIITNGGPNDSTRSIVLYLYQQAFESFQVGYASTIALVVFAIVMVVTLLQLRVSRRWMSHD
ncbi:carbohydrate ABC transporter permease [Propionibacteriaceae bacterium Y1685]|uniref:carbohydrate ABC transporter permease n=1 Tax=Microlunatus sp. Y1700 TaxID=3418487 RepID=UPI003B7E2C45